MENLPQLEKGKSRDIAGASVGVSGKAIDMAAKVMADGTLELVEAVDAGEVKSPSAPHVAAGGRKHSKPYQHTLKATGSQNAAEGL